MKLRSVVFPLALSIPFAGSAAGCSLDAHGIAPTVDASTADVITKPEGGPLPTNWCATIGAGHDFCADFDASLKGTEPGAWCNGVTTGTCNSIENGGTLTLDTTASTSPPASANAKTMAGGGAAKALLTREFPGDRHPLSLAFDARVDAAAAGKTAIAGITLENVDGNPHQVALLAAAGATDAGAGVTLSVVEVLLGGLTRTTPLSLTLPLNTFARVEVRVGIAPNTVTVIVNGVASSPVTIDAPGSATGRAVQVGLDSTPAAAWQLHFDDVTFDFTK